MDSITIQTLAHDKCTGCGACYNRCPVNAIEMQYDAEGFLYPVVDESVCTNCGLCNKVCPELNYEKVEERIHKEGTCYATMAEDSIRIMSSSGGMFSVLANAIYEQEGAVCGAVYSEDYQEVYHIVSTDPKDLIRLRGSKYVQSDTEKTFYEVEKILKSGKPVLYVGCPCQIAGLYTFLMKDYELLYTVDLICHGANSVFAYQSYIEEIAKGREIVKVDFRDKSVFGWSTSVKIHFSDGTMYNAAWNKNKFYEAFLGGIMNRECCATCHYAKTNRIADITLGDFWQVHRWDSSCNDWKGTSLVLLNSDKGEKLYKQVEKHLKLSKKAPLDFACQYNGQLMRPNKQAEGRKYFFKHLMQEGYHKALWYGHRWRYDVGLVGWWFSANYGSVLTYYALGKILEDMTLLPIMIRIPKLDNNDWELATRKNIEFMQKYFLVSKPRSFENMHECNNFCDAFMLGSDQLWVAAYQDLVGHTFYLDFADETKKKIAYATSLGYAEYTGSEEDKQIVCKLLKRFDAISVRESSGVEICKKEFGVDAVRMLDPVFLCDGKYYDLLAKNSKLSMNEKYILCYILDPTDEKRQAIRYLEETYNMKAYVILDMKTFEICKEQWKDETVLYDVGIEEWVYLIKNCEFLMTDSHHGACFGMIYHKNLATIVNPRRGKTRFDSLFNLLEISDSLITEGTIIEQLQYFQEINYEKLDVILKREIDVSINWLKEALNKEKQSKQTVDEDLFAKYFNKSRRLEIENRKLKNNQKDA